MAYRVRIGGCCWCEWAASDFQKLFWQPRLRVGLSARAFCGEAANHRLFNCTPPCDNPIALGMRASTSIFRCRLHSDQSALLFTPIRRFQPHTGARRVFTGNDASYLAQRPLSLLQHRTYQCISIHQNEPTIYALSTAPGKAAIAVIRVSGSACREVLFPKNGQSRPNQHAADL
jgi:hypothetical protein